MTQLDLITEVDRVIAQTSLDAYAPIRQQLPLRDLLMVAHVDDYCRNTGRANVTGGELAEWLTRDILSVRPRLSMARKAGWLETAEARKSRAERPEKMCAPYKCAVPRAAIDRAIREAERQRIQGPPSTG